MGSLDIVSPLCMKINVCHDTLRTGRGPSACDVVPERLDRKAIFREKLSVNGPNLASPRGSLQSACNSQPNANTVTNSHGHDSCRRRLGFVAAPGPRRVIRASATTL